MIVIGIVQTINQSQRMLKIFYGTGYLDTLPLGFQAPYQCLKAISSVWENGSLISLLSKFKSLLDAAGLCQSLYLTRVLRNLERNLVFLFQEKRVSRDVEEWTSDKNTQDLGEEIRRLPRLSFTAAHFFNVVTCESIYLVHSVLGDC